MTPQQLAAVALAVAVITYALIKVQQQKQYNENLTHGDPHWKQVAPHLLPKYQRPPEDSKPKSPLIITALLRGHKDVAIRLLTQEDDIAAFDVAHKSCPAAESFTEVLKALGSSQNAAYESNERPLDTLLGIDTELMTLLLDRGAQPNCCSMQAWVNRQYLCNGLDAKIWLELHPLAKEIDTRILIPA